MTGRAKLALTAGDAAVLLAFVLIGMNNHGSTAEAGAAVRFAVLAGPLLAGWGIAAPALGAWPLTPATAWRQLWGHTVAAWLLASPLALTARALLLGSATLSIPFLLVTLGVGGLMLLAWRSVYLWAARRRAP